jgi:hypothetical protein
MPGYTNVQKELSMKAEQEEPDYAMLYNENALRLQ